ncbi:unnamed protein product [Polarella glacialis]|uniref:Uncharacterized protein n=1 Tax=Polarella glacialis TaxID=89957 RepID=A0A813LRR7_POLGL|nr:unnamed protein product [Polarella glacialis]
MKGTCSAVACINQEQLSDGQFGLHARSCFKPGEVPLPAAAALPTSVTRCPRASTVWDMLALSNTKQSLSMTAQAVATVERILGETGAMARFSARVDGHESLAASSPCCVARRPCGSLTANSMDRAVLRTIPKSADALTV